MPGIVYIPHDQTLAKGHAKFLVLVIYLYNENTLQWYDNVPVIVYISVGSEQWAQVNVKCQLLYSYLYNKNRKYSYS